jgi:hypothetical protein
MATHEKLNMSERTDEQKIKKKSETNENDTQ